MNNDDNELKAVDFQFIVSGLKQNPGLVRDLGFLGHPITCPAELRGDL